MIRQGLHLISFVEPILKILELKQTSKLIDYFFSYRMSFGWKMHSAIFLYFIASVFAGEFNTTFAMVRPHMNSLPKKHL